MQSNEIRSRFLAYFQAHGHTVVDSAALIPSNDPTLYFTNAGMVQFKDVFLEKDPRDYSTATTSQKCLRVSGKHNDLEVVGRTARHHTFFEMLGNFSFGDYFKADAIRLAWNFLTKEMGLSTDRLWVTVYEDDDEAHALWQQVAGVSPDRIQRLGAKDNFWSMGDTGPCGPCSEIFYDHGEQYGPPGGPETESDRYIEIWNLVFMQFDRDSSGEMTPLPKPSIDTGMGLERIAAVMQGVYSNYDTDTFQAIIKTAADIANITYKQSDDPADVALRVIADHSRATAFLMADGVMPSNTERGYVLRRIMRRAIRFGVKLGLQEEFLHQTVAAVITEMGDAYPELVARQSFIVDTTRGEERRFRRTLSRGLDLLGETIDNLGDSTIIDGVVAARLYETFGFPIELTQLIASERGVNVDMAGFTAEMERLREINRQRHQGTGGTAITADLYTLADAHPTQFVGYNNDRLAGAEILALLDEQGSIVETLSGKGAVIVDETPFYAESGGQVGDTGALHSSAGRATVTDTRKPVGDLFVHSVNVEEGALSVGDVVELVVDASRRNRTRLNHTATHLLHAALRTVLGEHVMQKGSLVDPERLRFDFSHPSAMTADELATVEDMVYSEILRNAGLTAEVMAIDEAKAHGAMALFGEKYGAEVRVISIPGFSVELCGGTHASATGDIGLFRITGESGISAGVRRIEAVTGMGALHYIRARDNAAQTAARTLKTSTAELPQSIQRLQDGRRQLERELERLKQELAVERAKGLRNSARDVGGIQVIAAQLDTDANTLRTTAEWLRDSLQRSAVVVLGSAEGDAVKLVAMVSKDISGKQAHAGNIIRAVAKMVGGGGGGRPDMAQAGGRNVQQLPQALDAVFSLVGEQGGN